MKITWIPFLVFLFAGTASAQDAIVVDTLDWQRYYPLEIGNTWEYGGLDAYTSTIVGDTVANGHQYFIRRDSILAVGNLGPFSHTFFLRYDTAGTVVALLDLAADTMNVPIPPHQWREDFPDFLAHFNMRAAFGDTLSHGAPDTIFYVYGGYNEELTIGEDVLEVDARKCFAALGLVLHTECYAADIGYIGGGNLHSPELKYARVGANEYGNRVSTSVKEEAEMPERMSIVTIYPNPFRDEATVAYRLPKQASLTIEVFNVLGQRVWREEKSVQAAGEGEVALPGKAWSAGVYLVRLTTESGMQSVRSVVVAE